MLLRPHLPIEQTVAFVLIALVIPTQMLFLAPLLKTEYRRHHSEMLFQKGLTAYHKKDFKQAAVFWRKSYLEQKPEEVLRYRFAESANNLGVTLTRLKRDDEAESKLRESISITRALHANRLLSTSLYQLGKLRLRAGDSDQAKVLMAEYTDLLEKTKKP